MKGQPNRSARMRATVVFPLPDTPMKTSTTGFSSSDNARYAVPRNAKRMTHVVAPVRIEVMTLGEARMAIAAAILADGVAGSWEGLPIVEVFRATLDVSSPRVDDPIIARDGDPERLAWMHANFTDHSRVADLGDADSYATRLYDYAHAGRDQIRWVIKRLTANPWARDATVTTLQPLTDATYIPCVSLLDFWLVEVVALQARVAGDLGVGMGTLTMTVKSAHIYQTELGLMRGIIAAPESR